jgi:hypothetical protein
MFLTNRRRFGVKVLHGAPQVEATPSIWNQDTRSELLDSTENLASCPWQGHAAATTLLHNCLQHLLYFFTRLSMRTLFLTGNKTRNRPWRKGLLVSVLVLVLLIGAYAAIEGLIGLSGSAEVLLGVALVGCAVVLVGRWLHVRRMQSSVRDLKDSALW